MNITIAQLPAIGSTVLFSEECDILAYGNAELLIILTVIFSNKSCSMMGSIFHTCSFITNIPAVGGYLSFSMKSYKLWNSDNSMPNLM